ncbi:MAG: FHA domain-containing protein, partial [Prevotella sp.]|nr:FHA domain-containing protein [Prevotella sp.]
SSQLQAKVDKLVFTFGDTGSVPKTVSRQHCKMTVLDDGSYMLQNLKMENDTFVNGMSIQTKKVTQQDVIELGSSHYKLRWDYVQAVLSKTVNVSHLEKIWTDY